MWIWWGNRALDLKDCGRRLSLQRFCNHMHALARSKYSVGESEYKKDKEAPMTAIQIDEKVVEAWGLLAQICIRC
ncbi:hypothetical protein E3N88_33166 [Mikania micrantha]|uniref:Uncharacterized protein n=1 Tax=Mikania micrantha TaxID=192012 RepID=A0A5N6MB58_9ASTR|nr:hypothetical protein E3N88_33166 [Mikania micrantha]